MKAFIVQEPEELTGDVFYADTDIEARKAFMGECAIEELAGIICRRCRPLDDKQGDRRAQVEYLLGLGWWFNDGEITADDRPFVSVHGGVYRTWCEWLREREVKALRAVQQRDAERRMWGMFPWAEAVRVHLDPNGHADADIRLPYLAGTLRYRERDDVATIERRDLAVFRQAYTVNRDAEARP